MPKRPILELVWDRKTRTGRTIRRGPPSARSTLRAVQDLLDVIEGAARGVDALAQRFVREGLRDSFRELSIAPENRAAPCEPRIRIEIFFEDSGDR